MAKKNHVTFTPAQQRVMTAVVHRFQLEASEAAERAANNHDRANAERMRADEMQSRQIEAEKAASIAQSDLDVERRKNERLRQIIATLGEVVTHAFMRDPQPSYSWTPTSAAEWQRACAGVGIPAPDTVWNTKDASGSMTDKITGIRKP